MEQLIAYVDGGSRGNPGPAGFGVRFERPDGTLVHEFAESIGTATNNVAEYRGLIAALEWARAHGARQLHVRSDSELLVRQMLGRYKVRHPGLAPLHARAAALAREIGRVTFEHVDRSRNAHADRLANAAMDGRAGGGTGGLAPQAIEPGPILAREPPTDPSASGDPRGEPTMDERLSYRKAAPDVYEMMRRVDEYLETCGLEPSLLDLVYLRASQINGCASGIDRHWKDLRAGGASEQKLSMLDAWREWPEYSARERAALEWTEAVTRLAGGEVPDRVYDLARSQFTEAELAKLTLAVAAINSWNRLNIAFRTRPGTYDPALRRRASSAATPAPSRRADDVRENR